MTEQLHPHDLLQTAQYFYSPTVAHFPEPMGVWSSQLYPENVFGSSQSYSFSDRSATELRPPGNPARYTPRSFQHSQQPFWVDPGYAPNRVLPSYGHSASRPPQINTQLPSRTTVPEVPRGPPRKPKQTGHALWIGNIPAGATIHELKDYCSRGAPDDIGSVFLISKSNCAFANYRSHAACEAAMTTFRDVLFRGQRLVCRLRMQPNPTSTSSPTSLSGASSTSTVVSSTAVRSASPFDTASPLIVGGDTSTPPISEPESKTPNHEHGSSTTAQVPKVPARFFLIKSLTVQDLLASVNNGTWEAQSHNEHTLQQAFENSDNVYLVFSANRSGEYFGLARVASSLYAKKPDDKDTAAPATDSDAKSPDPQSTLTPATAVAPSGRVYDDSARGTIFWEADRTSTDNDRADNPEAAHRRQFDVEWLSTLRIPFFRTRGLRNPWNGLKEVKIARDGTELEPNIGRHLVRLFY